MRCAHSPNTYSTVAWRWSLSSGVLTSLALAEARPRCDRDILLAVHLERHRGGREAGADIDLPQQVERGVVDAATVPSEELEEHQAAAGRHRPLSSSDTAGARFS